jgi:hypothetical protein
MFLLQFQVHRKHSTRLEEVQQRVLTLDQHRFVDTANSSAWCFFVHCVTSFLERINHTLDNAHGQHRDLQQLAVTSISESQDPSVQVANSPSIPTHRITTTLTDSIYSTYQLHRFMSKRKAQASSESMEATAKKIKSSLKEGRKSTTEDKNDSGFALNSRFCTIHI